MNNSEFIHFMSDLQVQAAADGLYKFFNAMVDAGFTEEQAIKLLIGMIKGGNS